MSTDSCTSQSNSHARQISLIFVYKFAFTVVSQIKSLEPSFKRVSLEFSVMQLAPQCIH